MTSGLLSNMIGVTVSDQNPDQKPEKPSEEEQQKRADREGKSSKDRPAFKGRGKEVKK